MRVLCCVNGRQWLVEAIVEFNKGREGEDGIELTDLFGSGDLKSILKIDCDMMVKLLCHILNNTRLRANFEIKYLVVAFPTQGKAIETVDIFNKSNQDGCWIESTNVVEVMHKGETYYFVEINCPASYRLYLQFLEKNPDLCEGMVEAIV